MHNLSEILITALLFGIAAFILSMFRGSSESSDFISDKHERAKECAEDFKLFKDFIKEEVPRPGDLLQCERLLGVYDHWGVFVESNVEDPYGHFVIHLNFNGPHGTDIRRSELKEVIKGSKCRINNLKRSALKRGLNPKSRTEVAKAAEDYLKKFNEGLINEKYFEYNLMNFNCEHFATLCAFGKPFSEQAESAKDKVIVRAVGHGVAGSIYTSFEDINRNSKNEVPKGEL